MKNKIITAIICLISISLRAQVGIGPNTFQVDEKAMLEVLSGASDSPRGILIPRFDMTQEINIGSSTEGLLYYSLMRRQFMFNNSGGFVPLNPWRINNDSTRLIFNRTPSVPFRVGIGTSDPQSTLEVNGTITSTDLTVSGAITSTTITSTELVVNSTGAVKMPVGTTSQQPNQPAAGMIRFNSDVNSLEYFDGTKWESVVPAGTIVPFAGLDTNVPAGWLLCEGQSVSQSTYSRLFAAISTAWGDPGGSNFNLPDLRGRFLRGVDGGAGNDLEAGDRIVSNTGGNASDAVGSYQDDATALPTGVSPFTTNTTGNHNHFIASLAESGLTSLVDVSPPPFISYKWSAGTDWNYALHGDNNVPTHGSTNTKGAHSHTISGGDPETRPKNVYVNFIIKY